jgi:hypothetical protein
MMVAAVAMHPIWQSGAVVLGAVVAAALLLQLLVQRFLPAMVRQDHTALGAAIFSVIGTTYAVLLAFMATTAWAEYSAAQALVRHEADRLGSIFEASRGLAEPAGAAIRADVARYLSQVIEVEWPEQIRGDSVAAREPVLAHLQRTVLELAPASPREQLVQAMLANAVSDVTMARRDRRLATHGTIPDLVWVVLLAGGALVVGFSFLLGGPTRAVHLLMTAALAASGVLVLLLIVGLSSPFRGAVTVAPDAYRAVLAEIQAP